MLVQILLAIVAVGGLCVAYGVFIERRAYRLVRRTFAILPAEGPPTLSVLHLSDLHFVRGDRRKSAFLASLPQADVTVVTGDFLAEPEAVETTVEAVHATRGRSASWFVLGSNDYYSPRPLNPLAYLRPHAQRVRRPARRGRADELRTSLEADGWQDLTNAHRQVELGGLPIELLGLDDAHIARADLRVAPRREPDRFGFAVMHSPDSAPEAVACGYRLVLAGHTHGGQVRMPIFGAIVTNSDLPRRLAAGALAFGDAVVHVSRGLGTSKYAPFRFLCRPEATLIELRRASGTGDPPPPDTSAQKQ